MTHSLAITHQPRYGRSSTVRSRVLTVDSLERVGLGILAATLLVPQWIMTPWDFEKFGLPKYQVLAVLAVTAAMVMLVLGAVNASFGVRRSLPVVLAFVLTGQALLASFLSGDVVASVTGTSARHDGFITILFNTVLFVLAYRLASAGSLDTGSLMRILAAGSVPVAVYAWCQGLGIDPFVWEPGRHGIFSTMGNQIFLGTHMALAFSAALAIGVFGTARRWVWLSVAAVALSVLVVAPSWTAGVGVATTLVLVGVAAAPRRVLRRTVLRVAATVCVAGLLVSLFVLAGEIIDGPRERQFQLRPFSSVLAETEVGWRMAGAAGIDRPFTGVGPERLGALNDDYGTDESARVLGAGGVIDEPQSSVLEWLAETGFPGALLWSALLACTMVGALRVVRGREGKGAVVAAIPLVTLGAVSLVSVVPIGLEAVWWVLAGAVLAGSYAGPAGLARP